jgi:RimJ/RimL family protein N-acetyltransferase
MICNNSKIISLHPIEPRDLPQIQKWRNQPSIQGFVREYRELSGEHINSWYNSMITNNKFEFFLIKDTSDNPIGVTGLTYIDWINKNADLHLAIYEHGWVDKVYAPEVLNIMGNYGFNHLNLHKIYAEVYEIDKLKLELFQNKGFKIDASLRDHYYYKGKYCTSHIVSLLKKEWI